LVVTNFDPDDVTMVYDPEGRPASGVLHDVGGEFTDKQLCGIDEVLVVDTDRRQVTPGSVPREGDTRGCGRQQPWLGEVLRTVLLFLHVRHCPPESLAQACRSWCLAPLRLSGTH
jgi:hypothetical protein